MLSDRGLPAALDALAGRSPVPVEVAGAPPGRLPEPVELAAYYVVSEALANVAKYSEASQATVNVARENGTCWWRSATTASAAPIPAAAPACAACPTV